MAYVEPIDAESWGQAIKAMRSYAGMGSIKVQWHPYKQRWLVEIDFSDGTTYTSVKPDINEALREAAAAVNASPPRI
jgi:hypothetical protein